MISFNYKHSYITLNDKCITVLQYHNIYNCLFSRDFEMLILRYFIHISLLIVLSLLSIMVGVQDIDIMKIGDDEATQFTLLHTRLPRTAALIMSGIGMSVAGLIMQQITQNKFVSPTTAGTLDAAKLGLILAFLCFPTASLIVKSSIAFGVTFFASIVFLKITDAIRYKSIVFVPIVGLMFGGILGSISTFLAYKFDIVQNVNAWMMGDFSAILKGNYEIIYIAILAIIITYLYANQFTLVGMGESLATNLGLNYRQIVNIGIFLVAITVSVVVITVGVIPFLGLIIPNIISLVYGDKLKRTLPMIALIGANFLLACDIIGRLVLAPYEMPIGMTVGIIGGIIFLYLIFKNKK